MINKLLQSLKDRPDKNYDEEALLKTRIISYPELI
jgi:hypothetical protein